MEEIKDDEERAMTGPTRRARAAGGRPHKVTVQFSELELDQITEAASRAGQGTGAWLGETATRVARSTSGSAPANGLGPAMQELMMLRAELLDARTLLRNIGGNLNVVARHANTTGELPDAATRVHQRVASAVAELEQRVSTVDKVLERVRTAVVGGAAR